MGLTRTYNFLHLSIQELLAARHISKLPPDTQIEIVHGLLDHQRFAGVFRFFAGITRLRTPGIEGIIREMIQSYMYKNAVQRAGVQYEIPEVKVSTSCSTYTVIIYILNAHGRASLGSTALMEGWL